MQQPITALLAHDDNQAFSDLKVVLENQLIQTCRARTCLEVSDVLARNSQASLVFTDTNLPDGTWVDVVKAAAKAPSPVNVVVVARVVDVPFYIDVMEAGAFDLISPPFGHLDLAHVVRSALYEVLMRRSAKGPVPTGQAA